MSLDARLTTLRALWAAWKRYGETVTERQWAAPTRLGDWDVRTLYAHAASWPYSFTSLVERVRDVPPTQPTAAAVLLLFNRSDGIAKRGRDRIANGAREDAQAYRIEDFHQQFGVHGPRAIDTARRLGPVVVDYFGHAMLRLDEAVSLGIVEGTVHLLDLLRALDVPPEVPADALAHTVEVLTRMTPPVAFIELATGRGTADCFPVLT